jgi:hypothetical protein
MLATYWHKSDALVQGLVRDLRCKTLVTFRGLEGEKPGRTVQNGEQAALLQLIKTTNYNQMSNYEPRGRAFESLRAHQQFKGLG